MNLAGYLDVIAGRVKWRDTYGVSVGPEDNGRCWKFVIRAETDAGKAAVARLLQRGRFPAHQFRDSPDPDTGVWYIFHGPFILPRFYGLMFKLYQEVTRK